MNKKRPLMVALILTILLFFVNGLFTIAFVADSWKIEASLPYIINNFSGYAGVVDGKIYAVTTGGRINVYDPDTDTWTEKVHMPSSATYYAVAAWQNKIYVICSSFNSNVQVYDPATDTWEIKAPIPTWRIGIQANVVNDKIYVIGGYQQNGIYANIIIKQNEVYDPVTDSWSEMAPIPTAVAHYASAVMDNKIYVFGGVDYTHYGEPTTFTNLVQIFDPKTNQWTQGAPMSSNIAYIAATATMGALAPNRIYVIGGVDANRNILNWTQIYDTENKIWSYGASMSVARRGLSLVNVDDILFALGGIDQSGQWLTWNEQYTPVGYGSIITPSPSLVTTPTSTLKQSQLPTITPTFSPTPSETLQSLLSTFNSASTTPNANSNQSSGIYWVSASVAVVVLVVLTFALLEKKQKKK